MAKQTFQEAEQALNSYIHSDEYNIDEMPPKHRCKECGEEIYVGYSYYLVNDEILCKTCLDSKYKFEAY